MVKKLADELEGEMIHRYQRKILSRDLLTAQKVLRTEADIRAAGEQLRDGPNLFGAFQSWRSGLRTFEQAFGLNPAVRKILANDEIALAALVLAGRMPGCPNGLLGSARAGVVLDKLTTYFESDRWRRDRHRKTRPNGEDGYCWTMIIHNQKRVPSIDKLRKIHTKNVEPTWAGNRLDVPAEQIEMN